LSGSVGDLVTTGPTSLPSEAPVKASAQAPVPPPDWRQSAAAVVSVVTVVSLAAALVFQLFRGLRPAEEVSASFDTVTLQHSVWPSEYEHDLQRRRSGFYGLQEPDADASGVVVTAQVSVRGCGVPQVRPRRRPALR
jgi:hypothetical protein